MDFIEQIYTKPSKSHNGVVFLDRDGTIISDPDYLRSTDQIRILPGVIDGLKLLQKNNYLLIVITNQAVVAKGFITTSDLKKINDHIASLFVQKGVFIDAIYSCPHHPNADVKTYRSECLCRKPGTAMFERAIKIFSTDLTNAYMIGDNLKDIGAAERLGITGFLLTEKAQTDIDPKFQYNNFLEVAEVIINQRK